MLQKITVMIYLFLCHNAQNADNARMLEIWFDDKLREVYAANEFTLSETNSIVCN